jgi:SHS2 domain-containing protein
MPFEYLDHTADMAIRATGSTFAEALCEVARALFAIMVPLDQVESRQQIAVCVSGTTPALLAVEWLAELLAQRDLAGLVFGEFEIRDAPPSSGPGTLRAVARGEPIDVRRHDIGPEVKGVSYSGLHVGEEAGRWTIQCVVDL